MNIFSRYFVAYMSAKEPEVHDHYIVTSFLIFSEGIRVFHFLCFVHFVRN